jgi:outer membrane protein TolC
MKKVYLLFLLLTSFTWSQNQSNNDLLTLDAYLGYVKQFHPLVKQANLEVSQAQAGIIAARGGFDPKIEVDYENKQFKNSEYFVHTYTDAANGQTNGFGNYQQYAVSDYVLCMSERSRMCECVYVRKCVYLCM